MANVCVCVVGDKVKRWLTAFVTLFEEANESYISEAAPALWLPTDFVLIV